MSSNTLPLKLRLEAEARQALATQQAQQLEQNAPLAHSLPIEDWLRHYYPETFDRPFTFYQRQFWQWVEGLRSDGAQRPRVECHPRGTGKCLASDTQVLLTDGSWRAISALKIGDAIVSYNHRARVFESDRITNKWNPGIKPCLRITTASGKSLVLTPEHRVLTFQGWHLASSLLVGDWLASAGCVPNDTVPSVKQSATARHSDSAGPHQAPIHPKTGGGRVGGKGAAGVWPAVCTSLSSNNLQGENSNGLLISEPNSVPEAATGDGAISRGSRTRSKGKRNSGADARRSEVGADSNGIGLCVGPAGGRLRDGTTTALPLDAQVNIPLHPQTPLCGGGEEREAGDGGGVYVSQMPVISSGLPATRSGAVSLRKDTPIHPQSGPSFCWERIVGIEEAGEYECFDVEVGKNACLVTNGLVSHNSTGAETAAVRLLAKGVKRYVLYVSATDDQAAKHLRAVKKKLEHPRIAQDYPHLRPQIEKIKNKVMNWSMDRLVLQNGAVVESISLLGSVRGFKSEDNVRPDLIILDDIDKRHESVDVVQKKLDILAEEVLPTGTDKTDILFAQNLIHKDSICAQVLDGRAQIISDRQFSGPYPLVKNLFYEQEVLEDGAKRWVITGGDAFDPAISLRYCETLLRQWGPDAFLREAQQEVNRIEADRDFREWDEIYHLVTWPELVAGFQRQGYELEVYPDGRVRIPNRWRVGMGLDFGTTLKHPAAAVIVARPDERFGLSDTIFVLAEMILPAYPHDHRQEPELVSPGRVAQAIRWKLDELGIHDSQIDYALMSHEQSAAQNAMRLDLPEELQLFMNKWKAAKGSGVPQIQQLLTVDKTKPHPFRLYPAGHPLAGQPVMGKPRLIFVTEPGQGELYLDGNGMMRVRGAKDAGGFARARYEIPIYSYRNQGAKKIDDDFVDGFRGVMARFGPDVSALTSEEKFDAAVPAHLQLSAVMNATISGKDPYGMLLAQRRDTLAQMREEHQKGEKTDWEKTWGEYV